MASAANARAAPSRSRVAARTLVHAAQVVGVLVLLRAMAELPWVAAAAPSVLRVAASLLVPQRICFILANGIVIALATLQLLFPRDAAASTSADASAGSPSSHSNGDAAPRQNPLLEFLADPRAPEEQAPTPSTEAAEPSREEEVFEDKHAVHVKTKVRRAQPPRRTVSEKTGGGAAGRTATAAPELRRAKSENAKRRQRRSAAGEAVTAPAELGTDDAEAFRQAVEAFIAKQQTLFHREESLVVARSAAAAAAGGGEDGPAIAGAAAVAVK